MKSRCIKTGYGMLLAALLLASYSCKKETIDPTITLTILSTTDSSATIKIDLANAGEEYYRAGVTYSTNQYADPLQSPSLEGNIIDGSFQGTIKNLEENRTYFAWPYLNNGADKDFGYSVEFYTGFETSSIQKGDPGPSGGVIFWNSDGILKEARLLSTDVIGWGCNGTYLGNSSAGNAGQTNTNNIVASCGSETAAYWADSTTIGGASDWYLPSYYEMASIGSDLFSHGHIALPAMNYWTSSETVSSGYSASIMTVSSDGSTTMSSISKTYNAAVIVVRAL